MIIAFRKEYLDVVLVPSGLLAMFLYHLLLLYRYLHRPLTTVLGCENRDKRAWVDKVMESSNPKEVQNALTTITANVSAATYMSMISLTLCSLIGAWVATSATKLIPSQIIYGNTKPAMISIKCASLICCFLIAFSFFVQSARRFIHANYLVSTPGTTPYLRSRVEYEVLRGGEFWSIGLRALYAALSVMLWLFGPIPMFISSVLTVVVLYHHDSKKMDDQKNG